MAVIDIEYGISYLAEQTSENNPRVQDSLELEMVLQNSSIGHEYARMELEQAGDFLKQEVLLEKMENFKRAYFLARQHLKKENPLRLEKIETELIDQKVRLFGKFHA